MSETIGISDIHPYVPRMRIDVETIAKKRVDTNPDLERHFNRALAVTGQKAIRFPAPGEDSATMAAEAAYSLFSVHSGKALANLRYIIVGTETAVDFSKPIAAYVQGMLQRSGLPIPETLTTFQTQHACAGATLGMLSACGLIGMSPYDETGLVIATDIARYETNSTAEITQGAGAAALLIEKNPKLLALDIARSGYCSRDVDDFFRPTNSITAKVKGSYSMECYHASFDDALSDLAARLSMSPADILKSSDFVALHTPFRNMPEMAMKRALQKYCGKDEAAAIAWLTERGFYKAVDQLALIGNAYSASLFLYLAFLLYERYAKLGSDIVGKTILLASYGSGNTMIMMRGTIAPQAPEIIKNWNLEALQNSYIASSFDDYHHWTTSSGHGYGEKVTASNATSRFRLVGIRHDGYREYDHAHITGEPETKNPAQEHLQQSQTIPYRNSSERI
ncbi:MAG TPA: hydroxymethylglutaryl-CoA synthase [Spirochaetia bacterium]|nr:hydroxymethylglutaryl-CoA synthase [Spirochaetia bacterium]